MNEWISTKDRLPEQGQDVLMRFEHNMAVGWLSDTDEHMTFWCAYTDNGWNCDCDDTPTHWMPLPEPPEEGAKHGTTDDTNINRCSS